MVPLFGLFNSIYLLLLLLFQYLHPCTSFSCILLRLGFETALQKLHPVSLDPSFSSEDISRGKGMFILRL